MVIKIDKNIKYFKIKNPLESISASFSNISLIEPEIFKFKEWFQVKVPRPLRFQSSLIAVYDTYSTYLYGASANICSAIHNDGPRRNGKSHRNLRIVPD